MRAVRVVVVVALTVVGWVAWPRPSAAAGPCTDDSRACVIAAAQTYLDALVSHDASRVRLAPGVVRFENGLRSANGAADLRQSLETYALERTIIRIRDERWIVDGDKADVLYLLDVRPLPGTGPQEATAHVSERFIVKHGLVSDIEAIFCFVGGHRPDEARHVSKEWHSASLCVRSGPSGF